MAVNVETELSVPAEARQWGMICHIIALVGLAGNGIGFLVAPLVVWLVKKREHPFVDDQGKEAVNFQLTMLLAFVISFVLAFFVIGFFFLLILMILAIVMPIVAAIKANEGEYYRYPFTIRFIK